MTLQLKWEIVICRPPSNDIPVDPISLSLAYKAAQQAREAITEEHLQFGFQSQPKEYAIIRTLPDIPEEKLQAIDRTVVELKTSQNNFQDYVKDNEKVVIENHYLPTGVSYKEVGYLPAYPKHQPPKVDQYKAYPEVVLPPSKPCHCDDRKSNYVIRNAPAEEVVRQQVAVKLPRESIERLLMDDQLLGDDRLVQQYLVSDGELVQGDSIDPDIIDIDFVNGRYAGIGYNRFRRALQRAVANQAIQTNDEDSKKPENSSVSVTDQPIIDHHPDDTQSKQQTHSDESLSIEIESFIDLASGNPVKNAFSSLPEDLTIRLDDGLSGEFNSKIDPPRVEAVFLF